ncbi:MAG: ParB family transcriptional regulator, chromosome partitioning protein [Chloroflexota bacterium]|nr:ParB family transcriptional regulator, chromosome partitioning protein [Chloroflexota bacterium]
MAKRRGLGRGLDALIPGAGAVEAAPSGIASLPIDLVQPNPQQPRQRFSDAELGALADSIRQHGILQPLLVARGAGGYQLIAGERRLRAARMAGLTQVPVTLREAPEAEVSLALSLIENVQRDELNALEEAEAYRRLLEEFNLTHEAVARQVGKTRAHITNSLRLLGLAPAVQGALLSGAISAGHARALAGLDAGAQEDALRRVLRDEMNVREAEALAREAGSAAPPRPGRRRGRVELDAQSRELEDHFRTALQAPVTLRRRRRGGRLVVEFHSDEELDALYRRIVRPE